jgi:hypothetical protein
MMRTVSRKDLYEQIWSKPMTKVAEDYGVSGTALKKTCNRHQIPTPPLGYWAKLQHGKFVEQPPLSTAAEKGLDQIRIVGGSEQKLSEDARVARTKALQSLEAQSKAHRSAPQSSSISIPAVEMKELLATHRAISSAKTDGQGFAAVQGKGVVALKVAPALIDRALAILNRFITLAQSQACRLHPVETGFALLVDDEPIAFGLEEQPQKVPHEPTATELKQYEQRRKWGYSPQ